MRLPIVVTLRQLEYVASRNSRVQDWIAFADEIDDKYAVVFIPDTAQSSGPLDPGIERHIVCRIASWSIPFRMALYEAAYLNMAHMGGPLELALYNDKCRYAIFLPLNTSPHTDEKLLAERGFVIGQDLPFARPFQRIYWEPDELPAIRRAFLELTAQMETEIL